MEAKNHHTSRGIFRKIEPANEIMVLITYATSEGSGEPAQPRSLARASTVRTHEVWKYMKGPTKSQTSSPTFEVWVYGGRKVS